ncbi:MAG: arabinogalactan endo-1,4-beta-galactosidase [Clostridiales bacterium]|nr:arabinogalactan endo-1,4-beta-galactosidase [Clostridiales bacterium]
METGMDRIALGADLGWVSQLEQLGYTWVDDDGRTIDPVQACCDMGANAVRFRIFVNPPREAFWQKREEERCMLGFCDTQSVIDAARRVRDLGMDVMLGFHYSDHFADPEIQDIPEEWKNDDDETLTERIYTHTRESLLRFREAGIEPKWIQVGNEINNGIMWPKGSLKEAPEQLVRFLNAGYDAVKDVFPECQVITHMAGVNSEEWCVPFLDNFFANNGKTDLIGFSYYPYWMQFNSDATALQGWLTMYEQRYGKPVMIVEVGAEDADEEGSRETIRHCIDAVRALPQGRGLGVFYWEPEVSREILPDHYPLGAARLLSDHTLQFTKAMTVYREYNPA